MNPEELLTKTKEELIEELERFNLSYDEIQQNLVMIRSELLQRLEDEHKDGEVIGEYQLKRSVRVSYKTTLEQAEELGAVTKAIDTKKLSNLTAKGVKVPGKQETVYLSVRKLKNEENI